VPPPSAELVAPHCSGAKPCGATNSFVASRTWGVPRQLVASTKRTLLDSASEDSTAMVDGACHDHSTGRTHRPQRLKVQRNPYPWASRSSFHETLLQMGNLWGLIPLVYCRFRRRTRQKWSSCLSSRHRETIRLSHCTRGALFSTERGRSPCQHAHLLLSEHPVVRAFACLDQRNAGHLLGGSGRSPKF